MKKVIVIGGGASGLIAAITAKEMGSDVLIIERNQRLGKKILATGNGRCNFTNVDATELNYNHPYFVKPVFEQMSPQKTLNLFEKLGVIAKIEDEGKTYPLSEQASSIVDLLVYEIDRLKIPVVFDAKVISIVKKNDFIVSLEHGQEHHADKVILASGGMAMPKSGSDGSGYVLAQALGHHVTPIFPALVKLELESPYLKAMDGVKFKGIVELIHEDVLLQTEKGDILFTKYGISGPTILQISRKANALLLENQRVMIKVILVNGPDKRDIAKRFSALQDKTIEMSLIGLINKRLIHPILKDVHLSPHTPIKDIPKDKLNLLVQRLFDWRFKVIGSKDFDDAQVTAGGLSIKEFNPQSLESKMVPGFYACGEVLDIDGLCGGYNLQWAWSSGYVAGQHASSSL